MMIREKLPAGSDVHEIAMELLNRNLSFGYGMRTYITTTTDELVAMGGFSKDKAFKFVMKLIYSAFLRMARAKAIARGVDDTSDEFYTASVVLWGVFRAHEVMAELVEANFENHSSQAGEYIRFLTHNMGLHQLDSLECDVKNLKRQDRYDQIVTKLNILLDKSNVQKVSPKA